MDNPQDKISIDTANQASQESQPTNNQLAQPDSSSLANDIDEILKTKPVDNQLSVNHTATQPTTTTAPPTPKSKKRLKPALLIGLVIGLAAVLGGGALAYKTFVIDNQPQNFVDRALSQTMRNEQPIKVSYKLDGGKQDGPASIAQALQGHMVFDPKTRLATYHFELDNQMIGNGKIDLTIDINKQVAYSKIQLDKKVLNLAQFFLPNMDEKFNPLLEKLYNDINDKWFIINQEIAKELMESSGTDADPDSTKDLKNLLDQCRSSKDFSGVKFVEVTKELDPKNDTRNFEVKFSKTRFKESLEQQPNNQCLKEFKKQFDKNKKEFDDNQKLVLTIDKKTMLVRSAQISDRDATANLDFSYNANDKVELPADAKPLSELKTIIETLQQELMMSMMSDFGDADIKAPLPSRRTQPFRS